MNEPIPVSLAKTVLERAIRECDAATPGPWEAMGRYIDGPSDVLSSYVRCGNYCQGGTAEGMSAGDVAFAVLSRAGFRASLEYLRLMLGREDRDYPVNEWISQAVAPLIDHYDRVAPGWRTE